MLKMIEQLNEKDVLLLTELGRVVQSPIKLTQGYREFLFQFCNFLVSALFTLFALQFWAVIISNYTKH